MAPLLQRAYAQRPTPTEPGQTAQETHCDFEARFAHPQAELSELKTRYSALGAAKAQLADELRSAEAEREARAKAATTQEQKAQAQVAELTAQLDSGKPSEQSILKAAREQAHREQEMGRLRAQLKVQRVPARSNMPGARQSKLDALRRAASLWRDAEPRAQRRRGCARCYARATRCSST